MFTQRDYKPLVPWRQKKRDCSGPHRAALLLFAIACHNQLEANQHTAALTAPWEKSPWIYVCARRKDGKVKFILLAPLREHSLLCVSLDVVFSSSGKHRHYICLSVCVCCYSRPMQQPRPPDIPCLQPELLSRG